ncbi:hypothetical protein AB0442_28485 [Kitasatospora sp. NPDC085895]|uniref:hypothetical protein n=1 Tax=Kitasatospora sp. NPDC085895 TaxID=3155057 RepID=UPI00344FEA4D
MQQLYEEAGKPTESELIDQARRKRVPLDDSTLNDWLKGWLVSRKKSGETARIVVPRDQVKFAALVNILKERANRRRRATQSKVDFEQLRANAEIARRRKRRHQEDTGMTDMPRTDGLGWLLAEITDPFALEVHRAIDIELPAGSDDLDLLPAYVERSHDRDLQRVIQMAAGGSSGVAILIGASASGKTRACWESLQTLPAGWRLWRPDDPSSAVGQLPNVSSRTVIWLDDTHDSFLYTPISDSGENLARGLYLLLHDSKRAPVLVLDTMWPETWAKLITQPTSGVGDRRHQRAGILLSSHGIRVPSAFDNEDDRAALEERSAHDPRLALASAEAEDNEITQYLAGVPVLMERYHTAPEGARALIEAAMDAWRFGHRHAIPLDFLHSAAPAYIGKRQQERLAYEGDWLQEALAYAKADCLGVRGPLTPIPSGPGFPHLSTPHYRLADPLEQHALSRLQVLPPGIFWEAAVHHFTDPVDLLMLGHAAHKRWLLRHAAQLYLKSGAAGLGYAYARLSVLLDSIQDLDGAEELKRRAIDVANPREEYELTMQGVLDEIDPLSLYEADQLRSDHVWQLESAGRYDEAEEFARQEATAGHPEAMETLITQRAPSDPSRKLYELVEGEWRMLRHAGPDATFWFQVKRYGLEADGSVSAPWNWKTLEGTP